MVPKKEPSEVYHRRVRARREEAGAQKLVPGNLVRYCGGEWLMSDEVTAARIVISTAGTREEAARIARELVERRLAACVSRLPGLVSLYRWRGAVEEAEEVLLLIKTSEDKLPELEAALGDLHSYEVPEFLVLRVSAGSSAYLEWLFSSVTKG